MNKEYRILCEECDNETVVLTFMDAEVQYCPHCGSGIEPEDITEPDNI